MKKIDRETVQRIIDTADIVEVVSDFVNLKKRGANYVGLCPFHNERTPSFSVSKAKGICKCFSCGKGGSPVNFIMEHEQLSYYEALRYLAKKYHIEIKEREMTDSERQAASERESLMAVNDFALKHFCSNLRDTDDGRDIGLAYFRERGISDNMIERFKLGYAIDRFDCLLNAARANGYEDKYLVATGLCAVSEKRESLYDRFKGRVIYPVFSVSGRVVAFGGRTLRSDKSVAKYVNSPESAIYHKSNELYGLYQAKSAIVKRGKCILVEGYMDVISMHQAGVENVVASSGTSLTDGQIRLIHRFTENVTVIYDSDPAGIKASLRGIDMLLSQGLNIKVLLLPDGDDPDSFAQSHSAAEVEEYIRLNETDFIRFKTAILLKDVSDDPIARARVVNDIIRSIAVIPDNILRVEYVKECSRMLDIKEDVLMLQLKKAFVDIAARNTSGPERQQRPAASSASAPGPGPTVDAPAPSAPSALTSADHSLRPFENEIVKYVVKYGLVPLADGQDGPLTVIDYVNSELRGDGISLTDPVLARILDKVVEISRGSWPEDFSAFVAEANQRMDEAVATGIERIRLEGSDLADMEAREKLLVDECGGRRDLEVDGFRTSYIENILLSSSDDEIRVLATDLAMDKYVLSKVHTRYAHVETERERLADIVPRAVLELKFAILNADIARVQRDIRHTTDPGALKELFNIQMRLFGIRSQFAKFLGERIVTPPSAPPH